MSDQVSSTDPVIELERVTKVFEVFSTPRARMMSTLGLPLRRGAREEFTAVQDVDLVIHPGERVGLVGRNGAGKSTVLKMVAGLLRPTRGRVKVRGGVQALMELGTGFHPEFSGRQNVYASLAYQGVSGSAADSVFEDVFDFTELGEFIDRPVKTYSAGMYARLAFAAATAVRPEVLIIDEILGAGDAYFAQKSTRRMIDLTSAGTTLLFVSHDIAAVQMMCDRAVWIERGRVVDDDVPYQISRKYSAAIRRQSELRLRAENLKILREQAESIDGTEHEPVVCRLVPECATNSKATVRIHSIAASIGTLEIDRVTVGGARDNDAAENLYLLTSPKHMNWGGSGSGRDGRPYREVGDFGGIYGHAPFVLRRDAAQDLATIRVEIAHGPVPAGMKVSIEQHLSTGYRVVGMLEPGPAATATITLIGEEENAEAIESEAVLDSDARYGSDPSAITSVAFMGDDGGHRFVYEVGESLGVEVDWALGETTRVETGVWVVCIYAMDGRCVSQVLSPQQRNLPRRGTVSVWFEPLRIGAGDYLASVGLFDGLADGNIGNEDIVCIIDRSYRLRIEQPPAMVERGLVLQSPRWELITDV